MNSYSSCYSSWSGTRTAGPAWALTRAIQRRLALIVAIAAVVLFIGDGADAQEAKVPERSFVAANGLKITVKEVAPGNQDASLQVVCYLKHKPTGDVVVEAMVTLDKEMGGVIHSLRDRGDFAGDALETLYLVPNSGPAL